MGANKSIVFLLLAALAVGAGAQTSSRGAGRRHKVAAEDASVSPAVVAAESALDKQDYRAAEAGLNEAVAADAKDYRAWYDLGFLYHATGRKPEAIDAYRKSVAAKPEVFESNLNLGLLLASVGNPDAENFLRAATRLKPTAKPDEGLARAWLSLGRVLAAKKPDEALDAFLQAARLRPNDPGPRLSAGVLLERQERFSEAEREFRAAADLDPKSSEAMAGLANVFMRTRQFTKADAALRRYLETNPGDAPAHRQLARVMVAQGRAAEAQPEYEAALQIAPEDPEAQRELAAVYFQAQNYEQAAARYRLLVERNPQDAELHYSLGNSLMHARKFPEAQKELLAAVKLKADFAEAYDNLAIVASQNQDYTLAIQALDTGAKYRPERPGAYFLRATCYDHLKAYKQAAENYRQFLAVAAGKYPDEEWKARHRLVAIDPENKTETKKKK